MTAPGSGRAIPGFCPYCGYDNPPQNKFCQSCRRRLPDVLGPKLPRPKAGEPPSVPPTGETVPSESPVPARGELEGLYAEIPPEERSAPWFLVPVAILVIVLVGLTGVYLLPTYLGGHAKTTAPAPAVGHLVTLCSASNGSDCKGASFSLPTMANGALMNATGCDPFTSLGDGEVLWMNYTAYQPIDSIVLPSSIFGGPTGWTEDAYALVDNQTALGSSLWFSHYASGAFSEKIDVPTGGGTYCIGWWEPSISPVSVTWNGDVNVTYG